MNKIVDQAYLLGVLAGASSILLGVGFSKLVVISILDFEWYYFVGIGGVFYIIGLCMVPRAARNTHKYIEAILKNG